MDPEMPWLERSTNFPAEASCMIIVHIARWKDVWVPCRDPTESPRPPLHLRKGPNMPLITQSHVEFSAFNVDDACQFYNIVRNPNITVSNRKRDLNSHLTSRSICIVLPFIVYIPEVSLIPREVSWLHWTNSIFEWTSPRNSKIYPRFLPQLETAHETFPALRDEARFPCKVSRATAFSQSNT